MAWVNTKATIGKAKDKLLQSVKNNRIVEKVLVFIVFVRLHLVKITAPTLVWVFFRSEISESNLPKQIVI